MSATPIPRPTRRAALALSAAALGMAVTGCGTESAGGAADSDSSSTSGTPDPDTTSTPDPRPSAAVVTGDPADFDALAEQVTQSLREAGALAAYESGLVVLGSTVTWGAFTDDAAKEAAEAGTGVISLPDLAQPEERTVTFADGTTVGAPLLTSRAAAGLAITRECGPAERCTLSLDSAHLITQTRATNRGQAEIPCWEFTGGGLAEPLVVVAIANRVPNWPTIESYLPATGGLVAAEELVAVDGTRLDLLMGVGACDNNLVPRAYETADVIVVGGLVEQSDGPCTMELIYEPTTLTLAEPVGTRPLVSLLGGRLLAPTPG